VAKQVVTTTTYTDDLDGSAAASTVTFGWDGTSYEIDLSKSNQRAFEKAIRPYVDAGRRIRGTRNRAASRSASKHDLSGVRAWAEANGLEVSARGRIAQRVLEAYEAAH
jgi:hypothetical protein